MAQSAVRVVAVAALSLSCGSALAFENQTPKLLDFSGSFRMGEMFTFFFLMLGPVKILKPFVELTRKGDAAFARKLAFRGFVFSCVALFVAGVMGEGSLLQYRIPIPVLGIAAGVILFLVALKAVMEQFDPCEETSTKEYEPDLRNALFPLAFPTIVTPYGVSAVIVCLALTPKILDKGEIFAALFVLMVLNLVAMLFAKPILKYMGMLLLVINTVLGVIQVALGLAIILAGLRVLGFG